MARILLIVGIILVVIFFGLGWIFNRSAFPKLPSFQTPNILNNPFSETSSGGISVKATGSHYKTVTTKPTGWFSSGQDADIMLSGIDFNNTGGPLLFNHPGTVASDGTHLLLADRNNNRVLIWNKLPISNTPPDLVLGQKDFTANNPGKGLDQMNWPVQVSVGGGKVVVTDTDNNRILIWSSFPTQNGQKADLVINSVQGDLQQLQAEKKRNILWPWGVWTDGKKLAVTSTKSGLVLLWNNFPTQNNQPADIYLTGNGKIGTPRTIISDGNHLIVGDHNAKVTAPSANIPQPFSGGSGQTSGNAIGNFFWKSWPTADDTPDDFFMADPTDHGTWMHGALTGDGKLIMIGGGLNIWNSFPQSSGDKPDLVVGRGGAPIPPGAPIPSTYTFRGGDGSSAIVAGNKLYISLYNGNKIVVYNSLPTKSDQKPDFAIGSPDIDTNTLETNFIIENPLPATDGRHLFVAGGIGGRSGLYVWKQIPDENGARPDLVYSLPPPNDVMSIALFGKTLVLAGGQHPGQHVWIWKSLPLNGEMPDLVFSDSIGSVSFKDLRGVALDEKYFYLSDSEANKIYVWEGIPSKNSNPKFTISTDQPWRLSSDGKYLVVTATLAGPKFVKIYKISDLSSNARPVVVLGNPRPGMPYAGFNLPQDALISQNHLFVGDTGFNRVLVWNNIEDAIAGKDADVILGAKSLTNTNINPEIGRNTLFMPAVLAFDGSYLWVGEFKFAQRLLRFSVH